MHPNLRLLRSHKSHRKDIHHFCYVTVNGSEFDIKAYDFEGRLFDQVTLRK